MKGNTLVRRVVAMTLSVAIGVSGSIFAVSSAKAADVDLTMYSWRVEDKVFYEDVIKSFKAKNPGININYQSFPAADYQTILMSAMAAGKGPDIVHVRAYGALDQLVVPGYLSPLDLKEIKCLNNYSKDVVVETESFLKIKNASLFDAVAYDFVKNKVLGPFLSMLVSLLFLYVFGLTISTDYFIKILQFI
jgi:maltose-binding protein MalE